MRARTSPRRKSRSAPSSATVAPKLLRMPLNFRSAMNVVPAGISQSQRRRRRSFQVLSQWGTQKLPRLGAVQVVGSNELNSRVNLLCYGAAEQIDTGVQLITPENLDSPESRQLLRPPLD